MTVHTLGPPLVKRPELDNAGRVIGCPPLQHMHRHLPLVDWRSRLPLSEAELSNKTSPEMHHLSDRHITWLYARWLLRR